MKRLFLSTQYKKDYKKYKNDFKKKEALKEVLKLLKEESQYQQSFCHTCFMANTKVVWNVISKVISC